MSEDVGAGALHVDVVGDTTGFGRDVQRKIDVEVARVRARIKLEVDARRLAIEARAAGRRAQAEMRPIKIPVTIDRRVLASDLKAALAEIAATRTRGAKIKVGIETDNPQTAWERIRAAFATKRATVPVDADTTRASAKMDAFRQRQGRKPVKVKADLDASSLLAAGAAAVGLLKFPAIAQGISLAASALVQVAGGLYAVVSAAAPAANALLAIPGAIGVAAEGIGGLVASFSGIGKAVTAMSASNKTATSSANTLAAAQAASAERVRSAQEALATTVQQADRAQVTSAQQVADARRNLADAIVSANQEVVSAEQNLAQAQADATAAQKDLTAARKEAANQLKDLNEQARTSALDARQAQIDVERARANLVAVNQSPTSTALDRRQAQLDYDRSLENLKDTKRSTQDAAKAAKDANAKGVEGSDLVVAAKQRERAAVDGVTQAEKDLAETRRKANREIADAERGLARAVQQANWQQADSARQVADAQHNLALAMQASRDEATKTTTAQGALAVAMKNLSPAGQAFARFLSGTLMPRLRDVRNGIQSTFLPPLQAALDGVTKTLLPPLKQALTGLGTVFGGVATQVGAFMQSGPFQADFARILASNEGVIRRLGGAFVPLMRAFTDLAVAAGPFLKRVAGAIRGVSQAFAAWTGAQRAAGEQDKSKGLSGMFNRAYDALSRLWHILKSLGGILYNVGRAAAPAGRILLDAFQGTLDAAQKLTGSVKGQNKMRAYFMQLVGPVKEAGRLIVAIGGALIELGKSKSTQSLLRQIRTQLLPAITTLLIVLQKGFAKTFVRLLTDIANLFTKLGGGSGALTALALSLDAVVKALDALLSIPGVAPFVTGLLAIGGAATGIGLTAGAIVKLRDKFVKLMRFIPGVSKVFDRLGWGVKKSSQELADEVDGPDKDKTKALGEVEDQAGQTSETLGKKLANGAKRAGNALKTGAKTLGGYVKSLAQTAAGAVKAGAKLAWQAGKFLVVRGAQLAAAAASKAYAAAQWLVNAAMDANPITLIVIALVALGVAFYELWKHSETFRRIVTGALNAVKGAALAVFHWVKGHWPLLLAIITGPIGLAAYFIHQHWQKIKDTISAAIRWVIDFVRQHWKMVLMGAAGLLLGPFAAVVVLIATHWDKVKDLFRKGIAFVKDLWSRFWTGLKNLASGIWGAIQTGVTDAFDGIKRAFRLGIAAIKTIWNGLKTIVRAPVAFMVNTVYDKGIRWAWNKVAGLVHLPGLPELRFARGGVVPGYAPGRDRVRALLSPGEGVLVPEAVRGLGGAPAVHALNATYTSRPAGPSATPSGLPGFDGGGILGGIKSIGSGIVGGAKALGGAISGAARRAAAASLSALLAPLRHTVDALGHENTWASLIAGLLDRGMDGLLDLIRGTKPQGYATGGTVPGAGSRRDSILSLLAPGEGILAARTVDALGGASVVDLLNGTRDPISALLHSQRAAGAPVTIIDAHRSVVFEDGAIKVYNPDGEPASESVNRRLRRLAQMGAFG